MHLRSTVAAKYALGAVLAAFACSAGSAQAAPSEQVSRLDGADNFLSGGSQNSAAGVSDSGRYAAFASMTPSTTSYNSSPYQYYVRDIQANRTQSLGALEAFHGFDHAERSVLVSRRSGDNVSLVLVSLTGAADRLLWTGKRGLRIFGAKLSGDGSTVIFNDSEHNRAVSLKVATGALTTLQDPLDDGVSYGPGSIAGLSDDGRTASVVAPVGYTGTYATKLFRDGTLVRSIPGQGLLSPDGTAFAAVPQFSQSDGGQRVLTITNVTSGKAKTFPVPAVGLWSSMYADPVWTSTSAAKVVMRVGGALQQVDYATGTWTAFGGRYGGDVQSISRNGRYAEVALKNHVALADLTDAELPGGGDAWSPDVYLDTSASSYSCSATPPYYLDRTCALKRRVKLVTPAPWLPAPKRAVVSISANGLPLASGTLLLGQTLAGNFNSPTLNSTIRATVTDFLGRQRTLSWSTYHGL